ncbi:MAG: autotransporter domain-containing protein [Caulobacterales bacterium]
MHKKSGTGFLNRLLQTAGLTALGLGLVSTASVQNAEALVTPDTRTPAQAVDNQNTRPYWVGLGIRNEAGNSGGTCTGLLINPRTVLFAAHCVDGLNPGSYDAPTAPGNRAAVGYTTDPTFGNPNLRNWLFSQDFGTQPGADGRTMTDSVFVWYDPRSRFGPARPANDGTFLPADVAIAGFANPSELLGRDARDGIGLLFSPVTGTVPVTIGGFGQSGTEPGTTRVSDFQRRLGTNVMSFLGNQRDINIAFYGTPIANISSPGTLIYQDMYWADFDDPLRATRPFFNGPGTTSLNASTLDPDIFPGNATADESITAPGDSGSPLVTNAFGREVSLGVLSQGSRFFFESIGNPNDNFIRTCQNTNVGANFSCMGSTSGWNPLFLYWDQIVVNNPYKYVTAAGGVREWTDATTWTQEMDPLYFTLSGSTLVNGVPTTAGLGVSSATPNVGTVRPNPSPPATCAFLGTCPPTGGTAEPAPDAGGPALQYIAMPGQIGLSGLQIDAIAQPEQAGGVGINEFRLADMAGASQSSSQEGLLTNMAAHNAGAGETTIPGTPDATANTTALWTTGTLIPVSSGALTGPGSTNFVPNNVLGTAGLQNSTRWFEVNLRAAGTLNLSGNNTITIDRLSVRGAGSNLNITAGSRLNTTISSFVDAGVLNVDGTFAPRALNVLGGTVQGNGTITTVAGVGVVGGVITPGTAGTAGTLTINGGLGVGQTGVMGIDVASSTVADRFNINGSLVLNGGALAVNFANYRARFNDSWTVATATGGITGAFALITASNSGLLFPVVTQTNNALSLRMDALAFSSFVNSGSAPQTSFGSALDTLRRSSSFGSVSSLFSELDVLTPAQARDFLEQLSPNDSLAGVDMVRTTSPLFGDVLSQRSAIRQAEQQSGANMAGAQYALLDQASLGHTSDAAPTTSPLAGTGSADSKGYSVFANVRAVRGDAMPSTTGGTADFDATAYTLGAEASAIGSGFTLGAAVQFVTGETGPARGNAQSENEGYQIGAFGEYAMQSGLTLFGYAGFGETDMSLRRVAGSSALSASTTASIQSFGIAASTITDLGSVNFSPRISVDSVNIDVDGYAERGGAAALAIPDRSAASTLARASGTLFGAYTPEGGTRTFYPHATVGYVYAIEMDTDVISGATFVAAPGTPIGPLPGDKPDRAWFDLNLGLDIELSDRATLNVSYETSLDRDDAEVSSAQVGVKIAW